MNTILLRECKSTAEETEKKKGAAGDHHGQEKASLCRVEIVSQLLNETRQHTRKRNLSAVIDTRARTSSS